MKNQEIKKMSLANIDGKLTPEEMENIMAGSGGWSCSIALAQLALGTGVVIAGGPLTWWGVGGTVLLWANAAETCSHYR